MIAEIKIELNWIEFVQCMDVHGIYVFGMTVAINAETDRNMV